MHKLNACSPSVLVFCAVLLLAMRLMLLELVAAGFLKPLTVRSVVLALQSESQAHIASLLNWIVKAGMRPVMSCGWT